MKKLEVITKRTLKNADELEMLLMHIENQRFKSSSDIVQHLQITPTLLLIELESVSFARYLEQKKSLKFFLNEMVFIRPFRVSDDMPCLTQMLIIENVPDNFPVSHYAEYLAQSEDSGSVDKSLVFPYTYFVSYNENINFTVALKKLNERSKAGARSHSIIRIFQAFKTNAVILLCRPGTTLESLEKELANLKYLVIRPENRTFLVQFENHDDLESFMRDKPNSIIAEPFYSLVLLDKCQSLNEYDENVLKNYVHELKNCSEWFVKLVADWKRLFGDISRELGSLDVRLSYNDLAKKLEVKSLKPIEDGLRKRVDVLLKKFENGILNKKLKFEEKRLIGNGLENLNQFLIDNVQRCYGKIDSKSSQVVLFAFTDSIEQVSGDFEAFIKRNSVKDPVAYEMRNKTLHESLYANKFIFNFFKEELFKKMGNAVELEITAASIKFKSLNEGLKEELARFEDTFMDESIKIEDYKVSFQLANYYDVSKDTYKHKDLVNFTKVDDSTLRLVGVKTCVLQLTDKKSVAVKANVSKNEILCMRFISRFNDIFSQENQDIKLKAHKDYLSISGPRIDAYCLMNFAEDTAKSLIAKSLTFSAQVIENLENRYMEIFQKFSENNVEASLDFKEKSQLKLILRTTQEKFIQTAIATINQFV